MKHRVRKISITTAFIVGLSAAAGAFAQEPKPATPAQPASGAPAASANSSNRPAATSPAPAPKAEDTKPSKPAVPPDKVVMKVGGQNVTAGELEFVMRNLPPQMQRQVAIQGARPVGEQYALMLALSEKAISQHLDETEEFKQRMAWQRAQWLAQAEYRDIDNRTKISDDDVSQYYNAHKPDFEEVEVVQYTVRKKPDNAKPGMTGLTAQEAHDKIDAIRKALTSGSDSKKVAEDFKAPNVVYIDSAPHTVRRGQLAPELDKQAFDLKDGVLSDTVENAQSIFFIQVLKHKQPEPKEVSQEIEGKLREEKVKAALDSVKNGAAVWMDPQFFAPPAPAASSSNSQAPAANPAPKAPTSTGNPQ